MLPSSPIFWLEFCASAPLRLCASAPLRLCASAQCGYFAEVGKVEHGLPHGSHLWDQQSLPLRSTTKIPSRNRTCYPHSVIGNGHHSPRRSAHTLSTGHRSAKIVHDCNRHDATGTSSATLRAGRLSAKRASHLHTTIYRLKPLTTFAHPETNPRRLETPIARPETRIATPEILIHCRETSIATQEMNITCLKTLIAIAEMEASCSETPIALTETPASCLETTIRHSETPTSPEETSI